MSDSPSSRTSIPSGLELDVAIVGGGVGGLYTGYRLCTGTFGDAGGPASVGLFESSQRLGGRLESVVLPGMEFAGELGGMRYMTSQAIATTLIEKVFETELEHVEFPMGEPEKLLLYLRKQRFPADSWALGQRPGSQPFVTRYDMNPGDVGFQPDQLFNKVVFNVLMADPSIARAFGTKMKKVGNWEYEISLTAEDWDAIKPNVVYNFPDSPYEGMLVNKIGFWNLLKDQCSQEGYDFLADAGGYYSNTINWNAAEAFENMVGDFTGSHVSYRTIAGGYDKIAYSLAKHMAQEPKASIWTGARLIRVDRAASGNHRYRLTIFDDAVGAPVQVSANAVVLALPRRSLELLDQDCFLFSENSGETPTALAKAVPSVLLQPSFKLLMGFEEPWWKRVTGATSGESVTDLPMRQCYYFGTNREDTHSLFLGSYNDMDTVTFWSALQQENSDLFIPRPTALASASAVAALAEEQAPKVMVDEAMNQLRELHGVSSLPDPYITYYKDWGEDPFGGGYHAWAAGASVKDTMLYMRQPLQGESIHICGEAYSDLQGWIEGAFCVAEHMLQEHFGMDWPSWLSRSYYLGW
jgi:monoamine oxidase